MKLIKLSLPVLACCFSFSASATQVIDLDRTDAKKCILSSRVAQIETERVGGVLVDKLVEIGAPLFVHNLYVVDSDLLFQSRDKSRIYAQLEKLESEGLCEQIIEE